MKLELEKVEKALELVLVLYCAYYRKEAMFLIQHFHHYKSKVSSSCPYKITPERRNPSPNRILGCSKQRIVSARSPTKEHPGNSSVQVTETAK